MNLSVPTKEQVIHGIDRILWAFIVGSATVLVTTKDPLSKSTWMGAGIAGCVAVYQLFLSTITNH